MIIECSFCESLVDASVIASHESYDPDIDPSPFRASLLECPSCKNTLLAGQYQEMSDEDRVVWETPTRLWPEPRRFIPSEIPLIVRVSLEEGERCFKARAYTACAVMCGRALEGVCRHYKTENPYLGGGLEELLKMKVIDGRLYEWSQSLRFRRNIAAHASTEKISPEDARDLLEFLHAICEFVFVLAARYEQFKRRTEAKQNNLTKASQAVGTGEQVAEAENHRQE